MKKQWWKSKRDNLGRFVPVPLDTISCWKDGDGDYRNYIKTKGGFIPYTRYLIENKIGRKLKVDEIIHHINGIKNDDRIENLKLETRDEHTSHHRQGKVPLEGIKASQICRKKRRDNLKEKVIKLFNKNYSFRKIADKIKISRNTIMVILFENDLLEDKYQKINSKIRRLKENGKYEKAVLA